MPERREFLVQLKRKPGLAADHWLPIFKAARFQSVEIDGGASEHPSVLCVLLALAAGQPAAASVAPA